MEEKLNYYEINNLSYSSIKLFSIHPKLFKNRDRKKLKGNAISIGLLVDHLLTEDTPLESRFYEIMELPDKTSLMGKFVNAVFLDLGMGFDLSEELLFKHYEQIGFKNDSFDKVKIKFEDWEEKLLKNLALGREGLIGVDKLQIIQAKNIVDKFQESDLYKLHFEGKDLLYQQEIYGKLFDRDFKCKPDIIEHLGDRINVWDIKVTKPSEFPKNFEHFRYFYQASIYRTLIYNQYHLPVSRFKFVTLDPDCIQHPLIYAYPIDICNTVLDNSNAHKHEGCFIHNSTKYKTVKTLVEDLKWHEENDKWDYTRDEYLNSYIKQI